MTLLPHNWYWMVTVIENLPMEMRDRFTEMREMDLQVASELYRPLTIYLLKCNNFDVSWTVLLISNPRCRGERQMHLWSATKLPKLFFSIQSVHLENVWQSMHIAHSMSLCNVYVIILNHMISFKAVNQIHQ